jgi:hypothetical protein
LIFTPLLYFVPVGGQPKVPVPPSVVVLFELTMLGLLISTFLGVFLDSTFPSYRPMEYVPEISDGKIAVLFHCPQGEEEKFTQCYDRPGCGNGRGGGGAAIMTLLKQLLVVFLVVGLLFSVLLLFSMDVIKIDWITFMEIQPSFDAQEDPLPVPARSIPVDGAASIPNMGAPVNPVQPMRSRWSAGKIYMGSTVPCVMGLQGKGTARLRLCLPTNLPT